MTIEGVAMGLAMGVPLGIVIDHWIFPLADAIVDRLDAWMARRVRRRHGL